MQTLSTTFDDKSALPLNRVFEKSDLNALWQKAKELKIADDYLKPLLAPELKPHCWVANWRDNCLVLHVSSAAFATALRFQLPDLQKQLQRHVFFASLREIRCKVRPLTLINPAAKNNTTAVFSAHTIALLKQTALHISDDKLKNALEKLAARMEA